MNPQLLRIYREYRAHGMTAEAAFWAAKSYIFQREVLWKQDRFISSRKSKKRAA